MKKVLSVEDVCLERDGFPIFKTVSFELFEGQLLHLKGKNGAGKTTLLKAILGMYPLSGGNIQSQARISFIGHKLAVEPLLTVEENLKFMMASYGETNDCQPALAAMQLTPYRERLASQLSEGQKKRLGLARFYAIQSDIWLLDEPFSSLDTTHQALFQVGIEQFLLQGGSVIITSHTELHSESLPIREYVVC